MTMGHNTMRATCTVKNDASFGVRISDRFLPCTWFDKYGNCLPSRAHPIFINFYQRRDTLHRRKRIRFEASLCGNSGETWHWDRLCSEYFGFALSWSFLQRSIFFHFL